MWIDPRWTVCPLWAPGGEVLTKTILKEGLFWKRHVWSAVTKPSSFTITHTDLLGTQLTAYSLTRHVGQHCVYCSALFRTPRPLVLGKKWCGALLVCVCVCAHGPRWVSVSGCVPSCAERHELMFANRTILPLGFFIQLYASALRSMSVFVCVFLSV